MGKIIDDDGAKEILYVSKDRIANNLRNQITSYIRENYIPKADYENRLKADKVAMLKDLQLEIEEKATEICDDGWWLTYNYLIQQKINKLKGEESKHV